METYLTKEEGDLKVTVSYKTISEISGGSDFSLSEKDNLDNSIILNNAVYANNQTTIKINKEGIVQRSILKITTVFYVDQNQLPNKQNILERTEVYYSLKGDRSNEKKFKSTYNSNQDEYKDLGSNSFAIRKLIEIKLVPNTVSTKNQLIQFLNNKK